jgi:hypothetical protein
MDKFFKQKWVSGILTAALVGLLFYYCTYGLLTTGALESFPWLRDFFGGLSRYQMGLLSFFLAVVVFAGTSLSKGLKSFFAAAFIIIVFFWFKARVPAFSQALNDFWNAIINIG